MDCPNCDFVPAWVINNFNFSINCFTCTFKDPRPWYFDGAYLCTSGIWLLPPIRDKNFLCNLPFMFLHLNRVKDVAGRV